MDTLRIGTRKSPLALWQAHYVRQRLQAAHPGLQVELVEMTTQGDRILEAPLARAGGKGLFLKELEEGLLDGRIDAAVHSMKDVTVELPPGLHIPVVCRREDPRDAFVSNAYAGLAELPQGARLGTSSLRRQCQLRHARPDLQIVTLRGNVNTRLARLDQGRFDAIILAAAGLKRLGLADRIRESLGESISLPAVGQGAVGVECRAGDRRVEDLLACLDDPPTHRQVAAERAMNAALEGGCQVPIAGFATGTERLRLRGRVGSPDGARLLEAEAEGAADAPVELGRRVAGMLLDQGAGEILRAVYAQH